MIHGVCNLCRGMVVTPDEWDAEHNPTPTCMSCGATKLFHGTQMIAMKANPAPTREEAVAIIKNARQALSEAEEIFAEGERLRCVM